MLLALQLLFAHFLGDFLFQPYSWVKDKERRKLASPKLYFHILIHIALSFLFIWDLSLWYIPLIIGISHLVIDASKLLLQNGRNNRLLFFIDQALHILVIGFIVLLFTETIEVIEVPTEFWLYLLGAFLVTNPASISIKTIISVYTPKTEIEEDESLNNAGKYIGILERLLVYIFIITNHWEGVGFLIAAKSIFRFSDLTQSKDRKLTEYILIGTLLSFGIAIGIALLINGLRFWV
ncbi:DUF3307 domain-containing protein [Mesonia sp. K4-1]|uniref:DUF3307 domain-containing protein n=1 Tax=Mesonia sp. K4-1 TaxID=2602760 RepID=UPI0011CB3EAB|nr:DUF3307 domain-containing protein [Mesonia sp. K4-1]TXK80106.1 DUF3307 domain-containing protein [Mesonia sp. K4-1]